MEVAGSPNSPGEVQCCQEGHWSGRRLKFLKSKRIAFQNGLRINDFGLAKSKVNSMLRAITCNHNLQDFIND